MRLEASIDTLKGIGEKTAMLLHKLNIFTVGDMLRHYPFSYDSFQKAVTVSELKEGELCAFQAKLISRVSVRHVKNLSISTVKAADMTGEIGLTFFNMPYLQKTLKPGIFYVFRGRPVRKGKQIRMEHPAIYKPEEYEKLLHALQPRYPLTAGVTNKLITKAARQIFADAPVIEDFLPEHIREDYQLCGYQEALHGIHFPANETMLMSSRNRIVFDEFFLFFLNLRRNCEENDKLKNRYIMFETADTVRFLEKLPYELTNAQKKVWEEIRCDLQGEHVMNRLVQGDVGSGKTIIAVLALLMTVANGYQGAMMAPTEVLAEQHFDSIQNMTVRYGLPLRPILLTGSMSAKQKREAYEKIRSGEANLILGTHALIQEKVIYKNLALVVTDEQQRFGVRQREALAGKGKDVHVLVMSATPIPRTLAIILYGDLQVSIIDELPADRLPIKNCVVGTGYREKAYHFMQSEIEKGHQIYVICPMVEEGEMEGLENVVDYSGKLRAVFPENVQIAYLHGKMKPAEKNRIMTSFGQGNIDILVSTTVIEVGINVPNATVMMVENAERFGLAQLHQLRGRVGRGKDQSYCIFISTSESEETMERLKVLNQSNDGFFIAGEDLRLRGPGDLFGIRQSGILAFRLGDIYQDASVLKQASEAAERLLAEDPGLEDAEHELLRKWLASEQVDQVDFRSI